MKKYPFQHENCLRKFISRYLARLQELNTGKAMRENHRLPFLMGLVAFFLSSGVFASPIQVLLEEDFQAVTGVTGSSSVRTIADINGNNPDQLAGSPQTTLSNTGNGNASATSFNVRRGDNAIDGTSTTATPTLGNANFDNFFTPNANQFLVIGDNSGNIGGDPNGGTSVGASSTMSIKFNLVPAKLSSINWLVISFDYVFDANNSANSDGFVVELILKNGDLFSLLTFGAPSASTRGTFNQAISADLLSADPMALNFRLEEGRNTGSSAVGLDNLRVSAIPAPGALVLMGLGLVGMAVTRGRKAAG